MENPAPAEAQTEAPAEVPELVEAPTPEKLHELVTNANLKYGLKNYNDAADLYSTAVEMQDLLHGEMAPQNAELLYRYGRCLYHVAVRNSDVLGGKVAGEKKKEKKAQGSAINGDRSSSALPSKEEKLAEEVVEAAVEAKDGVKSGAEPKVEDQPYFQLTGMENWEQSDEEEEGEDQEGGDDDEEEDDFATAYEILDVARVLFARQLEAVEDAAPTNGEAANGTDKGKGKADGPAISSESRKIKELLADIHDLQAEIALENERFNDAIPDARASLALKQELHPKESAIVAEAHFKLSLALEFSSVTAIRQEQAQESRGEAIAREQKDEPPQVDEEMRSEAAAEMEAAIESCKLRIASEKQSLGTLEGERRSEKEMEIKDVQEILADMEQRLVDLRGPAVSLSSAIGGPAGAPAGSNPLAGMLGQILGESPAEQKARIEEATKGANDLTGLVRHRKKPAAEPETIGVDGKGKRKLDDTDAGAEVDGKRAKTEEPAVG